TFYTDIADLPDFEDYSMANRTYRYFTGKPLYPFGYGLSYTNYAVIRADESGNEIKAEVINNGSYAGDALVQVYVACDSPFAPLHPRLCGFGKISLQPGETKTVSITLDPLTNTVVNEQGERIAVEHYTLYAGLGQPDQEQSAAGNSSTVIIHR
ncbi:MAG: fibronectin type III-like domain-contianing protein, partial [Clostridia bacterium]|nr:fibronectin type III-like domain-contianing protein [Clostridia bacterium]